MKAEDVWAKLEATPGFNEAMERGIDQIAKSKENAMTDELPEDVKVLTDEEAAALPPNDEPADEEQAEPADKEEGLD